MSQDLCERSLRGFRASISIIGNDVKRQDHVCMTKTLYQSFLVFSCRDTAVSLFDKVGRECSSGQGPSSLLSGDEVCLFNRTFQQSFPLARICNCFIQHSNKATTLFLNNYWVFRFLLKVYELYFLTFERHGNELVRS